MCGGAGGALTQVDSPVTTTPTLQTPHLQSNSPSLCGTASIKDPWHVPRPGKVMPVALAQAQVRVRGMRQSETQHATGQPFLSRACEIDTAFPFQLEKEQRKKEEKQRERERKRNTNDNARNTGKGNA